MKETNDEYYDPYRYLDFEMFDDNETMECCQSCLRIRLASDLWVKPNEHILSFLLIYKTKHELTECADCLFDIYGGKIVL